MIPEKKKVNFFGTVGFVGEELPRLDFHFHVSSGNPFFGGEYGQYWYEVG